MGRLTLKNTRSIRGLAYGPPPFLGAHRAVAVSHFYAFRGGPRGGPCPQQTGMRVNLGIGALCDRCGGPACSCPSRTGPVRRPDHLDVSGPPFRVFARTRCQAEESWLREVKAPVARDWYTLRRGSRKRRTTATHGQTTCAVSLPLLSFPPIMPGPFIDAHSSP
jgi:hypothetical protein